MTTLFDRRAAITVNDLRFEFDSASAFHFDFRVERDLSPNANTAEATIYNLSQTSQGRIAVDRPQFVIEAGYLDSIGTLFKGEAVWVLSAPQKPGVVTKVKAADGLTEGRSRVSGSLAPGANLSQAMDLISRSIKVNAKKALERVKKGDFDGGVSVFMNGLTLSGSAKAELDKLAATHGFEWSIQNGDLQMNLPEETAEDTAIVISPSSGLIGSPVSILEERKPNKKNADAGSAKKATRIVIKGKSLLQAGIYPGRRLDIRSDNVRGLFKCRKVTHSGDTHAEDWSSEFEAVEL